jgi:1-deoxyxylulose-5-phosphate synthase
MPTTSTFIRSIVGIFSTPIEETLDALDTLVRAGKVRYLGASSMAAWQFSKALYLAKQNGWHRFVAMQNHYNLIYREEETRDGSGLRGSGRRTDSLEPASAWISRGAIASANGGEGPAKRAQTDQMQKDRYFHDDDFEVAAVAQKIAKEHGVTPTQIACAWILQAPGVTAPIIGATKTHHLKQAFEAVDIKFSAKEVRALEKPYRPHPILGREQARAAKMLK